jgi:hypothetical protein
MSIVLILAAVGTSPISSPASQFSPVPIVNATAVIAALLIVKLLVDVAS